MKDFGNYGDVIIDLDGIPLFGVIIDDSPPLRDLARKAVEIFEQFDDDPIKRIARLVGHSLASTWTFNDEGLELGSEEFPNTMSKIDQQRWYVGKRNPENLDLIEGVDSEEELRALSTQLRYRVGDCAVYSLTLAILLDSAGVEEKVELVAKTPHIFVAIDGERFIDLARRSHGKLERGKEKEKMREAYEAEDSTTITF